MIGTRNQETTPSKTSVTPSVWVPIAGVAGFFGATGLLVGFGFLVQEAHFLLLGLPYPPFSTTDYLHLAGIFLFDVFVLVLLINGAFWGIVPALMGVLMVGIGAWLWPPRTRDGDTFRKRYTAWWNKLLHSYKAVQSPIALGFCLLLLVLFTFYAHYPVFAQRYITTKLGPCGAPQEAPLRIAPVEALWRVVDCRRSEIREMILDQDKLSEAQAIYRNGVLCLLVLTVYVAYHPYNQFTTAGRQLSPGKRWLWSMTGLLLLLSFIYLPGGYAVLFRDKQAPVAQVIFKSLEKNTDDSTWQDSIMDKGWFLLFQNEKEVWLFRWPETLILQKEQLSTVRIGSRHWIFQTQ